MPVKANSAILVLAMITLPAVRSRWTTGASARAGAAIGQNLRAGAGRLARHVEEVLDADDRAVERTETYSCPRPGVDCIGCVTCDLRIDSEAGAGTLAFRIRDAAESFFQPVPGRAPLERLALPSDHRGCGCRRCNGARSKMQKLTAVKFHGASLLNLDGSNAKPMPPTLKRPTTGSGPPLPTCAVHQNVSYLRYWGRASRTAAVAVFDPHRKSSDLLLTPTPFCAYPRIESEKRKDRPVNGLRHSPSV